MAAHIGQDAEPILIIAVVIAVAVLVIVLWCTGGGPEEDRAGEREKRWYPRLKF